MNIDQKIESSEYSELSPEQRLETILNKVKQTPRYYNAHAVYSDSQRNYIQICHSKSVVCNDNLGFHADIGRHSADCPKLHINCKSSCIPLIVDALMTLQDKLVCEPDIETGLQPSTFIFKVLFEQEGFQSIRPVHGWPPRVVIYPSLLHMYPQIFTRDRSLDIKAMQEFMTLIEQNLQNIKEWDNTKYRARYFERLLSNKNNSIELVVGSTVLMGDRSNR
jgi:hypothetical protein